MTRKEFLKLSFGTFTLFALAKIGFSDSKNDNKKINQGYGSMSYGDKQ